jgi:hypothetical protein
MSLTTYRLPNLTENGLDRETDSSSPGKGISGVLWSSEKPYIVYEVNQRKTSKNELSRTCSMHGGRGAVYAGFWWGNLWGRDHLEDPGVDGRIIIRWIFRHWDVGVWTVSIWLRIGQVAGTCECGNEPSDCIKCR